MRRLSRTLVGSPSGRPQGESSWSGHGTSQGLAGIFPGARPRACKNLPRDLEESCHGLGWLWGPPRFTHSRKTNNLFFSSLHHGSLPADTFPRQNMESQNCQNNKRMIIHRILHSEAVSRKVVHVVRSTMLTPLQNRTNQPPVSGHQVGGDPWMLKLGPQKLCTGFVQNLQKT